MKTKILNKADLKPKVAVVIGTRPGIIMFSPIIRALVEHEIDFFTIHSGQHYSYNMDEILFEQLEIPKPAYHLTGIAEKKLHGAQTAAMLEGMPFSRLLLVGWAYGITARTDRNIRLLF